MTTETNNPYGLRVMLALAWPVVIARSAQAVVGFTDALMVAPLGEDELAAVTTGSLNFFAFVVFPIGLVLIVQSFASQLTGKGDLVSARRYAWYGLMAAGLAGAISISLIPLVEPILHQLRYEPAVARHMSSYLEVRLLAVGAVVGVEVLGNWYGGVGNTRIHMIVNMFVMAANVFLNWILIYGHLGAPALGTRGAAWASAIAASLGFLAIAIIFLRSRRGLPASTKLGLKRSEFLRVLRFGGPNGLNWFLEFAAFAVFVNVVVADLGTRVIAALMVVININSVSFMPAFGLGSAGAILVGQAIGAQRKELVPGIVRRTWLITTIWQGTVGLAYLLIPTALFSLFTPPDQDATQLVALGATMLAVSAAWQMFDAVAMTLSEALRGAGDTAWSMWARIILAWALFTPGSYLHIRFWGGDHVSVIGWLVAYMAALACALYWRFRSGAWRKIELTEEQSLLV